MLKLRLNQNTSPTSSTTTLVEAYDEIQKSNIFPPVAEDQSVQSVQSQSQQQQQGLYDCSLDDHDEHEAPHTTTTTEVEFLRQQLAERDAMVNELQRQLQEDRRAHAKLQEKWVLFFGTSSSTSSTTSTTTSTTNNASLSNLSTLGPMSSMSMHSTSTRSLLSSSANSTHSAPSAPREDKTQLLRLHQHLEKLEAEQEASLRKTVSLSVQLAETKAQVSTLESQVEEYKTLLEQQQTAAASSGLSLRFGRHKQLPATSTSSGSNQGQGQAVLVVTNSSERSYKSKSSVRSLTLSLPAPPEAVMFSITDIELNDDNNDDNNNDNDSAASHTGNNDEYTTSNSNDDSLSNWSQRPLSFLSERGSPSERGTSATNNSSSNVGKRLVTSGMQKIGGFLKAAP